MDEYQVTEDEYQVTEDEYQVTEDKSKLNEKEIKVLEPSKVKSTHSLHTPYGGPVLKVPT